MVSYKEQRKYKKLKKLVLNHELKHLNNKTIKDAIKDDYKDYFSIFNEEVVNEKKGKHEGVKQLFYFICIFPLFFM